MAAQKAAIEVTGENIANVNTPGYSRQVAVLETAQVSTDQNPPVGNGVVLASVQRAYDAFLQAQINDQSSTNGQQTAEQAALQRIEPLFNDFAADGLGASIQNFFNSWQDLAMNPQGAAERQAVLAKAQTLVDNFHQIANSLNAVQQDANQSLGALASDINIKAQQIAALNGQIRQANQSDGSVNALRDSRDRLIRDLAQKVGIKTLEQPDGTVSVSLTRGPRLVEGSKFATLTLQADAANSGLSGVILTLPGGGTGTDVTSIIAGSDSGSGELGGTLQVRDKLVTGFLAGLDELATTLASTVNSAHAAGYAVNGTTGIDFFTPPPAPAPPATFAAGFSFSIALNVTATDEIAAASTNPTLTGNGTGNNVNSLAIADLKNLPFAMTGGNNTLTGFYGSLVGQVGLAVQSSEQDVAQNTAMLKQLSALRESTSGVSLDEELAGLIKYQKAFEGAARLITTGQEMMDTILNMVR
jgi:flagellar hook-associated protein 1 FlgK